MQPVLVLWVSSQPRNMVNCCKVVKGSVWIVEVLVCVEDMASSSLQAAEGERSELCTIIWSLPQPAKEKTSFRCSLMYALSLISYRMSTRLIRFVKK